MGRRPLGFFGNFLDGLFLVLGVVVERIGDLYFLPLELNDVLIVFPHSYDKVFR